MKAGLLTGRRVGSYRLFELLGEGSFGVVYRSYHAEFKRHVAIKLLDRKFDKNQFYDADRFAREAQTVAELRHPHIVPIYEYGSDDDYYFLVMQLLSGGTLKERFEVRLREAILPSLGEVDQLLRQIASALTYAHEHSVIHRDMTSTNIMFDQDGTSFLVDFGVAKWMDENVSLTLTGTKIGTPSYMAPEQWRGEPLTPATDQYALGVVIYWLLTGQLPFVATSVHALMYQHLNTEAPPVHERRADLSEAIDSVIRRSLAKDPQDRYPSANAFAEAFTSAIAGMEGRPTHFFEFPLPSEPLPPLLPSIEQHVSSIPPSPRPVASHFSYPPEARSVRRSRAWLPLVIGGALGLIAAGLCSFALLLGTLFATRSQPSIPTVTNQSTAIIDIPTPASVQTEIPTASPTEIVTKEIIPADQNSVINNANADQVQLRSVLTTDDTSVRIVAFQPHGRWLASGGNSNTVQLWDSTTGAKGAVLVGHTGVIYGIAFNEEGTQIASASADGTVRVWNSASGQLLHTYLGHVGEVRGVAFSPDGILLASVGQDQTIRFWSLLTGEPQDVLRGDNNRILSAVFTPDGKTLASAWSDNAIALWDVATRTQRLLLRGHTDQIRSLAVNPQGTLLASASADNSIRLWNLQTDDTKAVLPHDRPVLSVAFSPDGSLVASGAEDYNIYLWNAGTGELIRKLPGHDGWVFGVAFSPDGRLLASAGGDGTIRLWDSHGQTQ